jgi:hypothetical protein
LSEDEAAAEFIKTVINNANMVGADGLVAKVCVDVKMKFALKDFEEMLTVAQAALID